MAMMPSLLLWTASPSGPMSFQPHPLSPHWGLPDFFETISGSSMASLRKSLVIEEPSLSRTSCGDSVSSLESKSQHQQPTTHRPTDRQSMSTRKSNSSFDSLSINNRMIGTNGS